MESDTICPVFWLLVSDVKSSINLVVLKMLFWSLTFNNLITMWVHVDCFGFILLGNSLSCLIGFIKLEELGAISLVSFSSSGSPIMHILVHVMVSY